MSKHTFHFRHFGHVPIVERLVEGPCSIKHPGHIRHIGHVPIVERLVEGECVSKHTSHIRHFGHVPIVERLVEGVCVIKHPGHIRHIGHVPIANLAVFFDNSPLTSYADEIISYRHTNTLIIQRRYNEFFYSSI